jgi:Na+/glutamate symporter
MTNQQIAIAISAAGFGLVVGFLAGYAVRAYISYLRRRPNYNRVGAPKHHDQPETSAPRRRLYSQKAAPQVKSEPCPPTTRGVAL